jgi:hypothetical protein
LIKFSAIFLIFFTASFISLQLTAQGFLSNCSIVYGLPFTKYVGKDISNTSIRPNFFLALQRNFEITDNHDREFIVEIAWSFMGSKQEQQYGTEVLKQAGIYTGLLYKIKWANDLDHGFYLMTGPAFRYLNGGDATAEIEKGGTLTPVSLDYRFLITDWTFAGGYDLGSEGKMALELRYNLGLQSVAKDYKIYNNAIFITFIIHLYSVL